MEKYLPGKTQVILKCDLSAWQKVYYHQVTDVGRVGMESGIFSVEFKHLFCNIKSSEFLQIVAPCMSL